MVQVSAVMNCRPMIRSTVSEPRLRGMQWPPLSSITLARMMRTAATIGRSTRAGACVPHDAEGANQEDEELAELAKLAELTELTELAESVEQEIAFMTTHTPGDEALAARTTVTMIPCLRYRDARRMIDWLGQAFGFHAQAVHANGDRVDHAQLVFGNGMLMLGSVAKDQGNPWAERIVQPDEIGNRETQSPYVVVTDVDAHCARARAAGATIVEEPVDRGYGGRAYTCLDPEGRLWSFGSYDPWATHAHGS